MDFIEGLKQSYPNTSMILTLIGLLIILKKIVSFLKKLNILMRKRKNLKKRYGAQSWALITGSSDGIGKYIAKGLAKEGFNIIISARTIKKLEAVKQQLNHEFPAISVRILPADYKQAYKWSFIEQLMAQISQLDVSIVVNNVGLDCLQLYADQEPQKIEDLLKVNCFPVAFLNRYFIPLMLKRYKSRGLKSGIINVSSIAGQMPMPYHNIYCSSKAYVDNLSRALAYEYPQIDIMSLRPSEVSTPMTCNKDTDLLTITAEQCAQGVLDQLGYEKSTYGHWRHQTQGWLYEVVPQSIFNYIFKNFVAPDEIGRRKAHQKKL